MAFLNSLIKLRPDGLYKVTIRYSYFYFYLTEISETFKTLGEARDWLLKQRCDDHEELVEEDSEEQLQENCETAEITGNAFEEDSDDDKPLVSDSEDEISDCETEQQRNIRLNKQVVLEDLKKKNRKHKKWNVRFRN